ncbi:MAG: VOC family protein [Proteobacteria bacterium]|nr:VOC family protein [Pseudomonadota bacterium]MBI3498764.1 VOC family protein [Pseudomonadota bacterium]
MSIGIIGIDHPVIAVRDMAAARGFYQRLGFTIPPRGSHLEWGTGNWCIMFQRDYLELRGIVDAERYLHGLDGFLERREGLMGVAFVPRSADETYSLARACGLDATTPRELTRRFELAEGEVHPRFRLVFFDQRQTEGLMASLVCQHLTPELIRRPEWTRHANGSLAVAALTAVVADITLVRRQQETLFGAAAVREANGRLVVDAGGGARLEFMTQAEAEQRRVALAGVALPYLSAITLAVAALAETSGLLERNGVSFQEEDDLLRVAPEDACGVILRFRENRR